jgi:hypothetical protein
MLVIFLLPVFVLQFGIVALHSCAAYHWGAFMEAEINGEGVALDF